MAIVAWGRLEGLFIACLMMVIQIANDRCRRGSGWNLKVT
jgi:hypothetical protein